MSTRRSITRSRRPSRLLRGIAAWFLVLALGLAGHAAPAAAQGQPDPDPPPGSTAAEPADVTGPVNSANARFLADAYRELLGREADDLGLDHHLSRLAAGGETSRYLFTRLAVFSAEGSGHAVSQAYVDILRRPADPGGHAYWTATLPSIGLHHLRILLLASDEYAASAGGTDAEWLEAVYRDVLGRSTEPGGREYWLGLLQAGFPRDTIAGEIYVSLESTARRADAHYVDVLGRAPSAAERAAAMSMVRSRGERELLARLWASDQAFDRYLGAVWP